MTLVLAVLLVAPALLDAPAPAVATAAPASVGPTFGDAGVVRTSLRASSNDFATALTMGPDNRYILAAGAGGDFGFTRFTTGVNDVGGTYAQSRTTTDFGGADDVPRAVATTASDRFVLAGSAGGDMALAHRRMYRRALGVAGKAHRRPETLAVSGRGATASGVEGRRDAIGNCEVVR